MSNVLQTILRRSRFALIAALAASPLTPAFGSELAGTGATEVRVTGNRVAVVVASPAPTPRTIVVRVRAIVFGRLRTTAVRIATTPATPVTTEVVFPGPVTDAATVGVVLDDGSPF